MWIELDSYYTKDYVTQVLASGSILSVHQPPNCSFQWCSEFWLCVPATTGVLLTSNSLQPCSYKTGVKQVSVSHGLVQSYLDLALLIPFILQTGAKWYLHGMYQCPLLDGFKAGLNTSMLISDQNCVFSPWVLPGHHCIPLEPSHSRPSCGPGSKGC